VILFVNGVQLVNGRIKSRHTCQLMIEIWGSAILRFDDWACGGEIVVLSLSNL